MSNCGWCGEPLPENAREGQRYHDEICANKKGEQMRIGRYGHCDPSTKQVPTRLCEWCGKELPPNSPSATKYHNGECKLLGYREHNARASRAFRFRKEMGIAKRR